MVGPEHTINDAYTRWQRIFWLMMVLLCSAISLLVWNAYNRNINAQALQASMVQGAAVGAAHEITLHVQALRTAVRLFAEKERVLLQQLAVDPNNVDIYALLLQRVKVYFDDGFAVTLADDRGDPVVADFDGFVGQVCQADLRSFTQNAFVMPDVYIHPNSIGYHFDILALVNLGRPKPHIFFISFYPRKIASILSRYQLTRHQLMLLNNKVVGLIEVDEHGSRDSMSRDHFISDTERARILYTTPVDQTRWELVDMSSDPQQYSGQAVWQETAVAIIALTLLSLYFLFALRQHIRHIDAQNATLRAQAKEIQDRSEQVINILERTTDAYVEFDADWKCTYLNRQAGKLLDQAPDLVIGQNIWDAFPDLAGAFYKDMQKAQTEAAVQVFSGFFAPSQRWLEIHVHPMPERVTVFMRDVTQERATWEQLKDSEARSQAILDHIADAIITIDKDGIIETFNPTAEQVFQYRAAEAIGKNVKMLMPDVDRDHHDQHLGRYYTSGAGELIDKTRELVGRRKDGRLFPLELCVTRVKIHDRDIFVGALRDISVRKEVESRIRELARFPDENPAPVLRVGTDGVISYANRPAVVLLRAWETDVHGDVPAKILHLVRDALATGAPVDHEVACLERVYRVTFMPVPEGGYVNLYGDDITDRKRAAQELKNHRDNLEELVSERYRL
ncbi:MAG: PAS domain S-box protein [Gammaproteobacteria bacterium]|nr:PAS domain S-box protein [Gammaproteobacteria bacterium]